MQNIFPETVEKPKRYGNMFKVNDKWIDELELPKVNNKDTRTT